MAGTNGTNLVNGNNNNTASPAMNGKSNGQMQQQHVVHQHQPQHIQATTTIHTIKDDGQQQQQPMVSVKEMHLNCHNNCIIGKLFHK